MERPPRLPELLEELAHASGLPATTEMKRLATGGYATPNGRTLLLAVLACLKSHQSSLETCKAFKQIILAVSMV